MNVRSFMIILILAVLVILGVIFFYLRASGGGRPQTQHSREIAPHHAGEATLPARA